LKKVLRILFKILLALLGILLLAFIVLKLTFNDAIPQGETGKPADELAYKMLDAINHQEFTETKEIHWTFRGVNRYEWKLQQDLVEVFWEDYQVSLQTKNPDQSLAYLNNKEMKGEVKKEAIAYATKNFNNDSFWLIAPHKVFDNGTKRELIKENGQQKLLVTYSSGGTTPGDSYLWELDENLQPVTMKMWVKIIPLDGLEAQWTNWEMTEAGFPLPEQRTFFGLEIPISEVEVVK
jgi:hypothetical protein